LPICFRARTHFYDPRVNCKRLLCFEFEIDASWFGHDDRSMADYALHQGRIGGRQLVEIRSRPPSAPRAVVWLTTRFTSAAAAAPTARSVGVAPPHPLGQPIDNFISNQAVGAKAFAA
jgi:hypothetical protein